eukprot:CAMPEP_0197629934 /NCGR_PEP_ID=MMETSP1338-20131121/7590_1 /TAXON_ID=43686 ORGANISM="Pelagodinium beii, Strain RCC1491" /NCGR_SAMPLE_ID=MMETSP1338 /ASSEMBLY_ACC=CAM_ASM_000754 /LENGTH=455 /DNA_ID=CAMNT_0043201045 /DNA_START=128 /DNA_END=1492 /DNA_ORIENTATION=+
MISTLLWPLVFLADCPLASASAVSDNQEACSFGSNTGQDLLHGRAASRHLLQVGASGANNERPLTQPMGKKEQPAEEVRPVLANSLASVGQAIRSSSGRWVDALVEGHDDSFMGAALILMMLTVLGSLALLAWFSISGQSDDITRKSDFVGLPPQLPQAKTSPKKATPSPSRPASEAALQPQPRSLHEPQQHPQPAQRLAAAAASQAEKASVPPLLPREELRPPTSGQAKVQHLCPGLVVPAGTECALAVKVPPPALGVSKTSDFVIDIVDLSGKPVLKAEVSRGTDAMSPSLSKARTWSDASIPRRDKLQKPVVTLKTIQPTGGSLVHDRRPGRPSSSSYSSGLLGDSSVLAHCYLATGIDGRVGIDICKSSGSLYGTLVRDETRPRFVMQTENSGVTLFFDGIFEDHAVLITDDMQEPLADAEPCSMTFDVAGKFYRLRASSSVDVGLLLCCL